MEISKLLHFSSPVKDAPKNPENAETSETSKDPRFAKKSKKSGTIRKSEMYEKYEEMRKSRNLKTPGERKKFTKFEKREKLQLKKSKQKKVAEMLETKENRLDPKASEISKTSNNPEPSISSFLDKTEKNVSTSSARKNEKASWLKPLKRHASHRADFDTSYSVVPKKHKRNSDYKDDGENDNMVVVSNRTRSKDSHDSSYDNSLLIDSVSDSSSKEEDVKSFGISNIKQGDANSSPLEDSDATEEEILQRIIPDAASENESKQVLSKDLSNSFDEAQRLISDSNGAGAIPLTTEDTSSAVQTGIKAPTSRSKMTTKGTLADIAGHSASNTSEVSSKEISKAVKRASRSGTADDHVSNQSAESSLIKLPRRLSKESQIVTLEEPQIISSKKSQKRSSSESMEQIPKVLDNNSKNSLKDVSSLPLEIEPKQKSKQLPNPGPKSKTQTDREPSVVLLPMTSHLPGHENQSFRKEWRHKTAKNGQQLPARYYFICSECPAETATSSQMKTHFEGHVTEKKMKCYYCTWTANRLDFLNAHMKNHDEFAEIKKEKEKVFFLDKQPSGQKDSDPDLTHVCNICKVAFRRKEHLESHKLTHENNKSYICSVCNFATKRNSDLVKHLQTCSKYVQKCVYCKGRFKNKKQLKIHVKTDHFEFPCHFCDKTFHTEKGYKLHRNQMHGSEVSDMSSEDETSEEEQEQDVDATQKVALVNENNKDIDDVPSSLFVHDEDASNVESESDHVISKGSGQLFSETIPSISTSSVEPQNSGGDNIRTTRRQKHDDTFSEVSDEIESASDEDIVTGTRRTREQTAAQGDQEISDDESEGNPRDEDIFYEAESIPFHTAVTADAGSSQVHDRPERKASHRDNFGKESTISKMGIIRKKDSDIEEKEIDVKMESDEDIKAESDGEFRVGEETREDATQASSRWRVLFPVF